MVRGKKKLRNEDTQEDTANCIETLITGQTIRDRLKIHDEDIKNSPTSESKYQ